MVASYDREALLSLAEATHAAYCLSQMSLVGDRYSGVNAVKRCQVLSIRRFPRHGRSGRLLCARILTVAVRTRVLGLRGHPGSRPAGRDAGLARGNGGPSSGASVRRAEASARAGILAAQFRRLPAGRPAYPGGTTAANCSIYLGHTAPVYFDERPNDDAFPAFRAKRGSALHEAPLVFTTS